MGIILAVVTLQALTTGLLIYLNKRYKGEDLYLSILFGVIFIHLVYKGALLVFFEDREIFEKLHGCFSLLYGPLLYFYSCSILGRSIDFKQLLLHGIPFFTGLGLNVMMLVFLFIETDFQAIMEFYHQLTQWMVFISFTGYGLYCFYTLISIRGSWALKQKVLVSKIIAGSFLVLSLLILIGFASRIFGFAISINMRYIYFLMMLGMFFSVLQIRMRILLSRENQITEESQLAILPQTKYKNSKIKEEELEEVMVRIQAFFASHKPYLDQEYSLDQLANDTGFPKLKITQALNLHLGQNFYQFINSARIEESKLLLQNPTEENLTLVGYEAGFKSKSTFYKYFKEATGSSPSDYKKSFQVVS
ncbi:helix-turn-helix domain-containing protein [Algoriphagus sp. AGSA1]|uniref:helix-turn-helix domain-containing protein n=1 Tax=Algoriphagus sp. AGSA1 TaxID=2907213 RepID=UPI001F27A9C2|nr:helix-turn-helix domain-containing protein [Algoriphagus sp. AGSA1]MCE7056453.1 helix-turn-helix domain-containing protein [Algoriphagus sp. AGSA1]